ncbi:G5 domain-containing protein [Streptococcus suis]|uniref:G5 domain-containing protein n=3 Tax=Streptococcus suis TaxID=1307 RepID=UPI000CF575B0|nr:G5 domain-containing protein [Streptococcus suis]
MKKRRYQSLVGLALVASLVNPTPWLGQSSLFESTKVLAAEEETPPEDIQEPDARQLAALNNLEKLLIEFESYINDDNKEEAGYFLEDEQANVERLLMATSNTSRGQVATVQWRALLERYNGASTPIPTPTPVVEIKEERRRELIPFTETEVSDETMLEGTKEVITKGVNGEVEIVEAVTYTDGVETIRKETSRSELVKMVPQVVRVGTKKAPVTITKEETKTEVVPFTEKRIADATLEEGKEVITTQGVKGERTIIEMITYMDGVEINRVEKSNTITKAPVTQVVTYGTQKPSVAPVVTTKETIKTETIPFTEIREDDSSLEEGREVVAVEGKKGERTIVETVTYTDGVETGRVVKSDTVTTPAVNKVIKVGTKKAPIITTEDITTVVEFDFAETRIADATLEEGKEVITTQGVKGERTIIEMITYMDGVEINRVEKSNTITKAPVTQVVTYGTQKPSVAPVVTTKETIKTETIPFTEIREDDSSLEEGREVVAVEGKKGERTIVETVTYTDGVETGRVVKSDTVTTPAVNKVIKVGTKKAPIITTEDITTVVEFDFAETRIADATLEEGKEVITTQGVKGERTIVETITYMDGVETGRVVKSDMVTTPAVNKVIKVGTKKVSPSDKKNKNVVEQPKEKMSDENVLPKTGEKSSTLTAIGLGLLAGMMVFIGEKRKRNN